MSIGLDHIRLGEGGKPLCDECARLEAEDEAKKRPPFSSFGPRTETAPSLLTLRGNRGRSRPPWEAWVPARRLREKVNQLRGPS